MTNEEMICAAVVCSVLGCLWERIPAHSHDFDLVFDDRREPLEIGAFTSEDVERRWSQTPDPLPSALLTESWAMHVTDWADLSTVQAEAEPQLAVLESHSLTSYSAGNHFVLLFKHEPDPAPGKPLTHPLVIASAALGRIGVDDAYCLTGDPSPSIGVIKSVSTVGPPTALLNSAVKSVATKPDNIAKLTSSHAKTHLCIPARTKGGAVWSIVNQGPPSETPAGLPAAIGRIWVLGRGPRVLYLDYGSAWAAATYDPQAIDHPERWEAT